AVDPEATHLQRAGISTGDNIFPGAAQSFSHVDVSLVPKKKSALPLILGLCAILLIGAAAGGYLILRSRATPAGPTKPNTPNGPDVVSKPEPVAIPGGVFQLGRNDSAPTEGPAHQGTINAVSMDKTEVTNAEYALKGTRRAGPSELGRA